MTNTKQHLLDTTARAALAPPLLSADLDAAYNENQAAMLLGVSVRTLQAWRVRGSGPPYTKLSRAVRYQRRALVQFLQDHTVTSTTEADAREVGR